MRYSASERRWYGSKPRPALPDPYSEAAPHHAERHRKTITRLPGGLVREDLGQPIPNKP